MTDMDADEVMLHTLQKEAFAYFLQNINPHNGLIADTTRPGSPCSIAVVGFAMSAYPVGVERGWLARTDAVERALVVLQLCLAAMNIRGAAKAQT